MVLRVLGHREVRLSLLFLLVEDLTRVFFFRLPHFTLFLVLVLILILVLRLVLILTLTLVVVVALFVILFILAFLVMAPFVTALLLFLALLLLLEHVIGNSVFVELMVFVGAQLTLLNDLDQCRNHTVGVQRTVVQLSLPKRSALPVGHTLAFANLLA